MNDRRRAWRSEQKRMRLDGRRRGRARTVGSTQAGISRHALDRYRLHEPTATLTDLESALADGAPVARELALALLGRRPGACAPGDSFVVEPGGRGLFVVTDADAIPTYLRLSPVARHILGGTG